MAMRPLAFTGMSDKEWSRGGVKVCWYLTAETTRASWCCSELITIRWRPNFPAKLSAQREPKPRLMGNRRAHDSVRGWSPARAPISGLEPARAGSVASLNFITITMAYISKSENSYITTSLLAGIRGDGRSLTDYRAISLEVGVAPLSNGSARARVGDTEVVAAIKLEVEDIGEGENEGKEGGRIACHVSWCDLFQFF